MRLEQLIDELVEVQNKYGNLNVVFTWDGYLEGQFFFEEITTEINHVEDAAQVWIELK